MTKTPEDTIWHVLRSQDPHDLGLTDRKQASLSRRTGQIIRALAADGFVIMPRAEVFTRDQVSAAVNAGADLVTSDLDLQLDDGRDWSLVDLAANAMLSLLDDPGMSLDDVIEANWQAEEPVCTVCHETLLRRGDGYVHYGSTSPDKAHEPEPEGENTVDMVRGWITG